LLTGTPAVEGKDREEILNAITLDEPSPPQALDAVIPNDLETIVLKAIARIPSDRYGTARELADDLRRFTMREPIRAKRPNIWQRTRKWTERHKPAVVAGAFVLGLAMLGLTIGNYLLWRKEEQTRTALKQVEEQRSAALANEAKANTAWRQVEVHLDRAFNDMGDFLRVLDNKELAKMPGIDRVRQELAASILRHYQSYLDEQSADPEIRHWTARAYQSVGLMQRDPRKGVEALVKSVTLSEALTREFPAEARYWLRLGHNRFCLAAYLVGQGLQPEAPEKYHEAMDAFEAAAQCAPDDARVLETLAWHLATSDVPTIRDPPRACSLARRAVELAPDYFETWNTLGLACYHTGSWSEAVTALEKGLAALGKKRKHADISASMRGDDTTTAMTWLYLAMAYSKLGQIRNARSWYDKAVLWIDKNAPTALLRLRAEAAEVLGIRDR